MTNIRHYQEADWLAVWPLLHGTFSSGDTYAYSPDSTEAEVHEALSMGFLAMQFNFVVSTNERAVRLWKKLGFHVVGTLPGLSVINVLGSSMRWSCTKSWPAQPDVYGD